MDPVSPSPAKRLRIGNGINLKVMECVRQFKLPQQFPSKVAFDMPVVKEISLEGKSSIKDIVPSLSFSNNMRFVPNKEANISNKLQKLKLKSPDGRDLGEFNVQLIPRANNEAGGKAISISKYNTVNKIEKPITLSTLKPQERSKLEDNVIQLPVPISTGTQNTTILSTPLVSISTSFNGSLQSSKNHKINTPLKQCTQIQQGTYKDDKKTENSDQENKSEMHNHNAKSHLQPILHNGKVLYLRTEKPNIVQFMRNSQNTDKQPTHPKLVNVILKTGNTPNLTKFTSIQALNSVEGINHINKNSVQKFSNGERNVINGDERSKKVIEKKNSEGGVEVDNSFGSNTKPISETDKKSANSNNDEARPSDATHENNALKSKTSVSTTKNFDKNVMVIVPNDRKISINEKERSIKLDSNTYNRIRVCANKIDTIPCQGSQKSVKDTRTNITKNPTTQSPQVVALGETSTSKKNEKSISKDTPSLNNTANTSTNGISRKDITNDLDILQQALSSVMDDELRAKALKALADCGIGIERHVPMRPPPDLMSIRNTSTQTTIFGILDKLTEDFVSLTADYRNVRYIKPAERRCQELETLGTGTTSNFEQQLRGDIPLVANTFEDDSILRSFDSLLALEPGSCKVKEVFSNNNTESFVQRTFNHLKKEFETAKIYDKNGMLSIHRAVKSDNIRDVQIQLLVLRGFRENVDVLTQDGRTSLELAIQYEVNPRMIKLLLDAGAQPTSSRTFHDSALIIASKMSSPVLPDLVKRVSNAKSLNDVDLGGFAPIHYCAQLGNTVGVRALISAGADVNLREHRSGRTPLFHALENRHVEVAQYLVDKGATSNISNYAGQTVLPLLDEFRNLSLPLVESVTKALKNSTYRKT